MYYFHWNTINTTEVVDFIVSVKILFGWYIVTSKEFNRISGVMVSMISSSAVDPRLGQTRDYKINICCFTAKNGKEQRMVVSKSE
jgi:hypothetical protein